MWKATVFTGVCLSTLGGGTPFLPDREVPPSQVKTGGTPITAVADPGSGRGAKHFSQEFANEAKWSRASEVNQ